LLCGNKATWLFLVIFWSYYACDALFYCTYGLFNDKSFMADFLLNAPHIAVSSLMLIVAYKYGKIEKYHIL
jgi:hypothetical protein